MFVMGTLNDGNVFFTGKWVSFLVIILMISDNSHISGWYIGNVFSKLYFKITVTFYVLFIKSLIY